MSAGEWNELMTVYSFLVKVVENGSINSASLYLGGVLRSEIIYKFECGGCIATYYEKLCAVLKSDKRAPRSFCIYRKRI